MAGRLSSIRLGVLLVGLVLVVACDAQSEPIAGISISGGPELDGASVYFDDRLAGRLEHLVFHDTWLDRLMKRLYPGSPAHDVVALNIDMSEFVSAPAAHVVRVEKGSLPTATHSLVFPPKPETRWVYLFVMPDGTVSERMESQ